jgi:hypothetical protein
MGTAEDALSTRPRARCRTSYSDRCRRSRRYRRELGRPLLAPSVEASATADSADQQYHEHDDQDDPKQGLLLFRLQRKQRKSAAMSCGAREVGGRIGLTAIPSGIPRPWANTNSSRSNPPTTPWSRAHLTMNVTAKMTCSTRRRSQVQTASGGSARLSSASSAPDFQLRTTTGDSRTGHSETGPPISCVHTVRR